MEKEEFFVIDDAGEKQAISPAYLRAVLRQELEAFFDQRGDRCSALDVLRYNDAYSRSIKGKLSDKPK
jgi:hypothetical protein